MLERFLSPDAPHWRAPTRIADIDWLDLLHLASCLPIVTIGAGQTALPDCCRRMADGTDGPIALHRLEAIGVRPGAVVEASGLDAEADDLAEVRVVPAPPDEPEPA